MLVVTRTPRSVELGQRFGRLQVVDPNRHRRAGTSMAKAALVRCDCGTEREVVIGSLLRGATRSCGCLNAENRRSSKPARRKHVLEVGQKFGRLTVTNPDAEPIGGERAAEALCECGTTVLVLVGNLVRGMVESCGCLFRERVLERTVWNREDPDWERRRYLWTQFHITLEQYDELLAAQGGHCALCPATPDKHVKKLHVDHDHSCCPGKRSCGKCVRGVLCVNCNSTLGRVEAIGLPELVAYYGYRLEAT